MRHRTINQVMTEQVVSVDRDASFKDIVAALDKHAISAVPVLDADRRVLGVVSEADLLTKESEPARTRWTRLLAPAARRRHTKSGATRARQLMTAPAITVRADDDIASAARILEQQHVKRLPVVDADGRLVGIVSRRDLLSVFLRTDREIADEIRVEVLERAMCVPANTASADVVDGVAILRGKLERRSMVPVTEALTRRVDGVVDVINHLEFIADDSHPEPPEPQNWGILHELPHRDHGRPR